MVSWGMMVGEVVNLVRETWFPVNKELQVFDVVVDPIKLHVHGLGTKLFDGFVGDAFGTLVAVWIAVGGCGCTSSFSVVQRLQVSWPL
jgi:hypothetical protein